MKSRLTQFLQLEQLSPARFADVLGVQRSGISHILSGRNKPGFDLIEKILIKFPDVSAEWLITGKGKMYKESTPLPLLNEPQIGQEAAPQLIKPNLQHDTFPVESAPLKQSALPEKAVNDERTISKIIILYADKSFSEYRPE